MRHNPTHPARPVQPAVVACVASAAIAILAFYAVMSVTRTSASAAARVINAHEVRAISQSPDELADAIALMRRGRYAEAIERLTELRKDHPLDAALVLAQCRAESGDLAGAKDLLRETAAQNANDPRPLAELAVLQFESGDHAAARTSVDAAFALDPNALPARWIDAELKRTSGDLEGAAEGYDWSITYYNQSQAKLRDPADFRYIGLAAAQYARWNHLSDQFGFLVNSLYPDALATDVRYWPAHLETARLFAEKFNADEASKAINAALAINPNAASVHAAKAALALQAFDFETAIPELDRALEINPQLLEAHLLKADLHLANFRPGEAIVSLQTAQQLNPLSEAVLGRLAAVYAIGQGVDRDEAPAEFARITAEVAARNAHAGEFYFVLAETLSNYRRWPQAEEFYQRAVTVMPQFVGARGALGMMLLRLGREAEARTVLDAAFDEDPFNVRVKNSLAVLEVLDGYETLESDHFHVKYDPERDALFAQYLSRYLEHAYPELCRDFNFTPPEASLFEVFNQAKNTDGHGWFSARMVGLPYVGTVGACAGQMVAMTSPDAMNSKFNWARVVRHEFVHVLNLQQTNFNVPHWFTEGLAVEAEGYPRQLLWDQLLVSRVPTGSVFNLDTINLGFVRPSSQHEWHLAYCQAELYVQFMREEFAADSPARMLQAYADNLTTPEAIERCFSVSQQEFERRYSQYLAKIVKGLPPGLTLPSEVKTFAEIDRHARANPDDADALAELAEAYLLRETYPQARKFAEAALELSATEQRAIYVLARLEVLTGERDAARERLDAGMESAQPYPKAVQLLSGLLCLKEDYAAAEQLVRQAQQSSPGDPVWTQELAAIYLRSGDDARLAEQLTLLAAADADQFNYRKKLALIAQAAGNLSEARRWAQEAIWIDVHDVDMHEVLARSAQATSDWALALEEFATLETLQPDVEGWPLERARILIHEDQRDAARQILQGMRARFPGSQAAAELLREIDQ